MTPCKLYNRCQQGKKKKKQSLLITKLALAMETEQTSPSWPNNNWAPVSGQSPFPSPSFLSVLSPPQVYTCLFIHSEYACLRRSFTKRLLLCEHLSIVCNPLKKQLASQCNRLFCACKAQWQPIDKYKTCIFIYVFAGLNK